MPPTTLSDLEALIFESSWALQTLVNRSGYSPAQRVLGRQPTLALDTLANQREYHLSCTQDEAWERAHPVRTAARKALMEADAKARVARARLARPRREVERLKFDKGEPVAVWRHGRRGTTAKVGPCFVVLQDGQTVWVTRRGQLWRCHVGQVFKMAESEKAGIVAVPLELLEAKTRLRYDSEKMRFVDVAQEIQPGDEDGSDGPPDGREPLQKFLFQILPNLLVKSISQGVLDRLMDMNLSQKSRGSCFRCWSQVTSGRRVNMPSARSQASSAVNDGSGGQSSTSDSSSSSSSSSSTTPRAVQGRAEWPPAGSGTILKKWSRFDVQPTRFRTSNSRGPMWCDVVQRVTIDNDTNEILKRENIRGDELPRDLHRLLPRQVRSLRTVLVYKKVTGHPESALKLLNSRNGNQRHLTMPG